MKFYFENGYQWRNVKQEAAKTSNFLQLASNWMVICCGLQAEIGAVTENCLNAINHNLYIFGVAKWGKILLSIMCLAMSILSYYILQRLSRLTFDPLSGTEGMFPRKSSNCSSNVAHSFFTHRND